MHNLRSRRRQPEVLHVDDRLSVDDEVVATCHLLPNVEQQRIVASLGDIDGCLEDMSLTHFTPPAAGRGDVHHFTLPCPIALHEAHAVAAGIELRQSVVVPQDAVALTRDEHGQRNLRVHLRQPSRQTAHVAVAVLELAEAEQTLIGRQCEGQRGGAVLQLVAEGCEHGVAPFVEHAQRLSVGTDAGFHRLARHLTVLHIEPVGQIPHHFPLSTLDSPLSTLDSPLSTLVSPLSSLDSPLSTLLFHILHPHRILRNGLHSQFPSCLRHHRNSGQRTYQNDLPHTINLKLET